MQKRIKLILVFVGLILLDQMVKLYFLKYQTGLILLNSGGAFGIANNFNFYKYIVSIILLLLIGIFIKLKIYDKFGWPFVLIFSGAISDLIDRIRLGGVVDYIDLNIWPSFNLADCFIVIGVVWFAILTLRSYKISS